MPLLSLASVVTRKQRKALEETLNIEGAKPADFRRTLKEGLASSQLDTEAALPPDYVDEDELIEASPYPLNRPKLP